MSNVDLGVEVVDVVYNLYEYEVDFHLPEAYIVSRDQQGMLAHIQQKATAETIGAFELELNPTRERLFQLIDELQPAVIEEHFRQGKRRGPTIQTLLKERDTKRSLQQYVHDRLGQLLQLAVDAQLPLSWNVERRVLVKDFLLEPVAEALEPQMEFKKTEAGVTYRLRMIEGDNTWSIRDKEVAPITNYPAWIVVDYRLYQISHLNGFLVKPFRERDEVHIPTPSVAAYFRNFITKVAAKIRIQAEGFAVDQVQTLSSCHLTVIQHLFDSRYVLSASMLYPGASFGWQEHRQERTSLEMNGEDVRIIQVTRDPAAEAVFIAHLKERGLAPEPQGNYWVLPDKENQPYAAVEWLLQNGSWLRKQGFDWEAPQLEQGQLSTEAGELTVSIADDNDWFDLRGAVRIGAHEFPFAKFVPYIKDGIRLFPLPDGTLFLIPEEWFSRYGELLRFTRPQGEVLRLERSQYMLLEHLAEAEPVLSESEIPDDFQPSSSLQATLRPYQLEGLHWLAAHYHQQLGACLADDMGLGKTLQTIALLLYAKEQKPIQETETSATQLDLFSSPADADFLRPLNALIVLPASLVFNWAAEIKTFAPSLSTYRHTGPQRHKDIRILQRYDIILTTYQTALRDEKLLSQLEYEYIVLDESQQIKNRESKVFKAINNLNARHKLSLSGTPIENSLSDLWSQMQFLNPGLLKSYPFFRKEFMHPIERLGDEGKKGKLRKLVQPYLLRRTKEEVAKDLPPQHTRVFYTEMTREQRRLYENEKSQARNYLLDNYAANDAKYRMLVVQTLTKLRQLANHPKLIRPEYEKESGKFSDVLSQWDTVQRAQHKVLFFSSFVRYLELFRTQFDKQQQAYSWLTGSLTTKERQRSVERFQQEAAVQAFFISIKTGGTGLNLTAADYVFILDPWWNPTIEQQAIARAHRIGQDKPVIALKFITRDSIEEKIMRLQERKSQLAEDIIGSNEKLNLDRGDIEFLLE